MTLSPYDVHIQQWAAHLGWPGEAYLRLGLAAVAGGLVGLERELRGRQAGFRTNLLVVLEEIGKELYRLVDEEDRRRVILDFERVEYLSSQMIGIILTLQKKLGALKNSRFVLCAIGPKLAELLKITRLDKILTVKPSQREALKVV